MKLTKDQVKKMLPGQVLTLPCATVAELDSTYQVALQARKEAEGMHNIAISRSNKTMTVTVRVD